jgi:hypothetical protein
MPTCAQLNLNPRTKLAIQVYQIRVNATIDGSFCYIVRDFVLLKNYLPWVKITCLCWVKHITLHNLETHVYILISLDFAIKIRTTQHN